jgi:type IV/VI secretion system ImpK/VasF family protein
MIPSVLRSFRPLFETLSSLSRGDKAASTAELRPLRADLRAQLVALKAELTSRLDEREAYLMLFAVVVHLDELVRTGFPEADHTTWPLLQQELFETDRGGELFYQSIVELLDSRTITPPVAQVYYFCLSLGFRGKYAQEPDKREQLIKHLRDWLAASVPPLADGAAPIDLSREQPSARVPPIRSRAWPWAIAAATVIVVHLGLSALASATAARWQHGDAVGRALPAPGRQAETRPLSDCAEGEPCRSS